MHTLNANMITRYQEYAIELLRSHANTNTCVAGPKCFIAIALEKVCPLACVEPIMVYLMHWKKCVYVPIL